MIENDAKSSSSSLSELSSHSTTDDRYFTELYTSRALRGVERARKLTGKGKSNRATDDLDIESIGGSFASAYELQKRNNENDRYKDLVYGTDVNLAPVISLFNSIRNFHHSFITNLQSFIKSCQFRSFIMFCILLNTLFLSLYNPLADYYGVPDRGNDIIQVSERVFLTIFTIEAGIKMSAFGIFYPEKTAYLRDPWNIMDFILVILGLVTMFVEDATNLSALRSFRLLRTFQSMKSMSKSLSKMTEALLNSARQLFYATGLLIFYFIVFGLIGVTLFKGHLSQYCVENTALVSDSPFEVNQRNARLFEDITDFSRHCSQFPDDYGRACPENTVCKRFPSDYTQLKTVSYDTFFKSALVVFQVMTLEGWSTTMYNTFDTAPWYFCLYYYLIILFGPLCILNLFVIILSNNYNEITTKNEFKDLISNSAVEARKIFSEIASEAKEQRERERLVALRADKKKMQMRLMYSYEKGFNSISPAEYEEYKADISVAEYDAWKKVAVPQIEKQSRSQRLKLLKNSKLFKSIDSLRARSTQDGSSVSISSRASPSNKKEVRFHTGPSWMFKLQKSFSMNVPTEPIGLRFCESVALKSSQESEIIIENCKKEDLQISEEAQGKDDEAITVKNDLVELTLTDAQAIDTGTVELEPELELEDGVDNVQAELIAETKKLIDRAQDLMNEHSAGGQSNEVADALKTLKAYLRHPNAVQNQEELARARMMLSQRPTKKDKVQLSRREPRSKQDTARGLLTDNVSIKICYRIVTNLWFQRAIVVLIALNVLMLSFIEFDMDVRTRNIITDVNFAFTIIFSLELLLKVYAFGGTFYFKDPLNLMDFCIISPAMLGLLVTRNNNTPSSPLTVMSNLRVFRLFQVVNLPQIRPHTKSLQKLIKTLAVTVKHVCPFFLLLMVFLLLFSILGLHLFGAKLFLTAEELAFTFNNSEGSLIQQQSFFKESGVPVVYNYIDCVLVALNGSASSVHCPSRANYDSFLWSFVTTFQVLTLENWNDVLETVLNADDIVNFYAFLYFLSVVFIGVFILLQLFLAVVIDSFNASHSDRDKLLKKAWLREHERTKNELKDGSSAEEEEDENLQNLASRLASQRKENQVNFEHTKHPAFQNYSLMIFSPTNEFRIICAKIINNKYVEVFIIICIFVSCILLAFDESNPVVYGLNLALVIVFDVEALMKIISFGIVLSEGSYLRDPWNILDFSIAVVMTSAYLFPNESSSQWTAVKLFRSFRVLRPLRVVRRFESLRIVIKTLFTAVVPCFWVAILCFIVYWIGGVLCIGLFGGKLHSCYDCREDEGFCLRRGVLDCQNQDFGCPGLDSVLNLNNQDIFANNTEGLNTYCFEYEGYTSTPSYNRYCGDQVLNKEFCDSESWRNPSLYTNNRFYERRLVDEGSVSFDSLVPSAGVLFEVSLLEGWPNVMHMTADIVTVGTDPRRNASSFNALFWVGFLTVTQLMLLQLLIAVIIETFLLINDKETGSAFMSPSQTRWVEARYRATRSKPQKNAIIHSMFFYKIASYKHFDNFVSFIVILNTLSLIFVTDQTATWYEVVDIVFAVIYIVEAFIKIRGYGCYGYFSDGRNIFDFIVVISVSIEILLNYWILADNASDSALSSSILKNVEVLRVLRVFKLLHKIEGVSDILNTLTSAIPSIINISFVVFLALFIFTILGVDLFKGVYPDEDKNFLFLNEYANFNTFSTSLSTLTRMATGESWNGIMHDLEKSSNSAYLFCISFMLVFQFLLLNLFVAVVLSSFIISFDKLKNDKEVERNIKQFSTAWTHRSRLWSRRMRQKLRQDIGIERTFSIFSSEGCSIQSFDQFKGDCFNFSKQREMFKREKVVNKIVKKMKDDDYLPYTEFTKLLREIPPPLGIKGLGIEDNLTESETMKLVAKVNIPVAKTGLINYQQTLFALVDHALMSESIPEQVQQLLDYRLPQKEVDERKAREEATADHSLQELYAAARLQLVLRNFLALRKIKKLRLQGFSEARIAQLISDDRDKATAAKVFTQWLRPRNE